MEPKLVWFERECPFGSCLKIERHSHPICPVCGAVRYSNLFCKECRKQIQPGGLRHKENMEYIKELKRMEESSHA